MRNGKGFTLVELMVTLAIVGILFATAIPVYRTWQQRAYGSEAAIMLKQLINAQIAYYLDRDVYFKEGERLSVRHDSEEPAGAVEDIYENLNILIPQGHFIDYDLYSEGDSFFLIISSSPAAGFDIFKDTPQIYAELDKDGKITIEYARKPEGG